MISRKPSRRDLLSSCADVGPEDGLDPRDFFRPAGGKVTNRKALQLCDQVARALSFVLGACGDPVLRDLFVQCVEPAPNASRLLVTVSPAPSSQGGFDLQAATGHLGRAAGMLRSEVAAAIHRRRTPELTFRIVVS